MPSVSMPSNSGAEARTESTDQSERILRLITILRRRKWIIVGVTTAFLVLGILLTLLMTPKYTATATLEIQRETRNFTMVQGAEQDQSSGAGMEQEFYQTQYGLLRARSLAQRVAGDLRLVDSVDFFRSMKSPLANKWFENGRLKNGASTREERVRVVGDLLLKRFTVDPERLSRLVTISFTSPDPDLSKRVVDAWSVNFIRATLARRFEATAYARNFLEQRLNQLRTKIDESERKLVDYATQEGIVNLPATAPSAAGGASGERSLVADDLANLNQELSRATADRVRAESRLGTAAGSASEALENTAISALRQRRAELGADYARMMAQFRPDYPPAQALKTQIDQMDASIAREENRVKQSLRETYRASAEREQVLQQQVGSLKSGLLSLRRRSIQYNIYERDVDTNRQLYDALLQRYKEIGVAGGVGVNNISVVDAAERPKEPSSPRVLLNVLAALILGLGLGAVIAFLIEQIDRGISDPHQVETVLGVPLLGTAPKIIEGNPVEVLADRKSPLAEAYLSVRANLAFSTDHGVPRILAVTSSRPAEGKTTTSYALALSIARLGRKVLLIDGDMRSPSIHHLFKMKNTAGLSNFLSGSDEISTLIHDTGFENLFVMPAGPQPPSAPELLSSERLERLNALELQVFDHIVFDAPPVMGLADAPLLASRVEGVVFVVESSATQRSAASLSVNRLRAANAQLLGVVLTKFDAKRSQYGYGYEYGYGGYGYGVTERVSS